MYNTIKKQEKDETYISTNEIAKIFEQKIEKIYEIFYLLKWIEKKDNWVITTQAGERNGAKQLYSNKSKQKYVMWNKKILENNELKNIINSLKIQEQMNIQQKKMTKKEKGDIYEKYIADHYRAQGYTIAEHGLENGRKDQGIDLIAKKDKEIILIQCKNWNENSKLKHNEIKEIRMNMIDYLEKNPMYKNMFNITKKIITPYPILDKSAEYYLKEIKYDLKYKVIPIN